MHDPVALPEGVVPVVSLCVFDSPDRARLLLGVRRPTATSRRHPDVLSTPTMRVPEVVLGSLLADIGITADAVATNGFTRLDKSPRRRIGEAYGMADLAVYVVESLTTRKLGWSDALVDGAFSGDISAIAIARDRVADDAEPDPDDTVMLTFAVELDGASSVPLAATSSYSRLDWVDTDNVVAAVAVKDPMMLIDDARPWEVCLHGLCVRSAAFAIDGDGS